jgi:hypothetical protein
VGIGINSVTSLLVSLVSLDLVSRIFVSRISSHRRTSRGHHGVKFVISLASVLGCLRGWLSLLLCTRLRDSYLLRYYWPVLLTTRRQFFAAGLSSDFAAWCSICWGFPLLVPSLMTSSPPSNIACRVSRVAYLVACLVSRVRITICLCRF